MNIKNVLLAFGLFVALAIPAMGFSADAPLNSPLLIAKDEVKCETCLAKLTALCEKENKVCSSIDGAAACQAFYEKCKASVRGRCGGPTICD
jgi:hypothetical protein